MATGPDNFDQLRRLLALKKYECPPPGFFHRFTREVMSKLTAPRAAAESVEDRTWIVRLWRYLELRPWLAGAAGAAVCALVVGWIVYTRFAEWTPPSSPLITHRVPAQPADPMELVHGERPATPVIATSTNPLPPGLFDPFGLKIERVNLSVSNR
ncbi:MAG: hypothetical protein N2379_10555 [Verrucomicrobiae bacterium]|nr:hypothetical protein [Verrucomicrobiae bacterium]MDW7979213.1 hypothetical protein [Verrucomicrobiales bacterium]